MYNSITVTTKTSALLSFIGALAITRTAIVPASAAAASAFTRLVSACGYLDPHPRFYT